MPTDQRQQLAKVFLQENARVNLSAIRSQEGVLEKHIADADPLLPLLAECGATNILDVGTGGGFPALAVALAMPQANITALDSTAKKLACVARIAQAMELNNIQTLHERAEQAAHQPSFRGRFDAVITRAAAPWPAAVELSAAFVNMGGLFAMFRGPQSAPADLHIPTIFGLSAPVIHSYQLPDGTPRTLWTCRKTDPTPPRFPRSWALIKQSPPSR